MPINNVPNGWEQYFAATWVFILSIWGGTVHTIKKVQTGILKRFTFREWVYDMIISGFVGVITYSICKSAGFDEWTTVVCIGIASHQGTRGLLLLEQWITDKLGVR